MKKIITGVLTSFLAVAALATEINPPAIIPVPQKMNVQPGAFQLTAEARILSDFDSRKTAAFLAGRLDASTGFPLKTHWKFSSSMPVTDTILLTTKNADTNLAPEGYELTVTTNAVVIRAPTQAGLFYGVQTLLQLLPPQILSSNVVSGVAWQMPCVQIVDQPRFVWRGFMLDVSRHFYTKDQVEKILDTLAFYKINTFHWHLTDDQGWRIEIKKYPKLTEIGAWRAGVGFGLATNSTTAYGPDGRYGGFYTQDDLREVVAYAAARHITVVPEIEMPGHSSAALVAYPQFGLTNGPATIPLKGGIGHGIYNPANPATFKFLDNVLAEVFPLFPGKYIHIGGDEVPPGPWKTNAACVALMKSEGLTNTDQLQSWFIRRIEKYVNANGKTLIGWSEITHGGLAKNAVVMDWIGGGLEAASAGHDVVMTPTSFCYLDHYQSADQEDEPRAIGGFLPLEKVYAFEPVPKKLPAELDPHVLGPQGNLWTEYVASFSYLEYMAFPRMCAMAEVGWSPAATRDWTDFQQRLKVSEQRLDELGVNYRHSRPEDVMAGIGGWKPSQITAAGAPLDWDVTRNLTVPGTLKAKFNYTDGACGIDIAWVALLEDGREISRDPHAGFAGGSPRKSTYTLAVPAPKPGAHYTLRAQVAGSAGTDSTGTVDLSFKSKNVSHE